MSAKRKPIQVFVSYAHRDRKHLDHLRDHLAGLEREGRVHCWWDGVLEVGKAWEPQILNALRAADVVVLLLTARFIASDYSIERELEEAREREKLGKIDLVPVLVDTFDLEAHWLGSLQMITVNGKSIVESHKADAAWTSVAKQIRAKVECLEGNRPVMQVLNELEEIVHSGDVRLEELSAKRSAQIARFETVSAFWRARSSLPQGSPLVSVAGTFSQYAPMLMGPPSAKRVLHRAFRAAIEAHRRFGERKRLTINACMSISAGQMVQRETRRENKKRLLGLYESIVRNAIPVFVLPEYYDNTLLPAFNDRAASNTFEAVVTGRLFELDNNFIRRFLARQGMDRILPPIVIDDLCRDAFALEVGGPGTRVEPLPKAPTRYLDGDLWLALESQGAERFMTSFVDISNTAECHEEMDRMRAATDGSQILFSCDELESIAQLLDKQDG